MAAILQNENGCLLVQISLKIVPKDPINKSALAQIMSWRQTGDKPLSEPMMDQFTDAYLYRQASMSTN